MFSSLEMASGWVSLITLVFMEIVLGIDNIIFVSLVADRLEEKRRKQGRFYGLSIAMLIRLVLLFGIAIIISLNEPLFTLFTHTFSGHDLIMLGGGLFLLFHTTREIHEKVEGKDLDELQAGSSARKFGQAIIQIAVINLIFSVDSILTALGMTQDVGVMMLAIILSMIFMMVFSGKVADFINKHPTMKMLALSFLLMIGILLVAEGVGYHIEKGYLYFAMAFSFFVELLNLRMKKKSQKNMNAS
ncbi:MAG TPA: TerC family protein [Chitinophagales bacterium]|nr:TerC family protein [Chitinophagales bacterium]